MYDHLGYLQSTVLNSSYGFPKWIMQHLSRQLCTGELYVQKLQTVEKFASDEHRHTPGQLSLDRSVFQHTLLKLK